MTASEIERIVEELLSLYNNSSNAVRILNDIGFEVEYVDNSDFKLCGNNSRVILPLKTVFIRNDLDVYLEQFYLNMS